MKEYIFDKEEVLSIPIKVEKYDELFNSIDYRELDKRKINEDIDDLIDKSVLEYKKKLKETKIKLIVYMPIKAKDDNRERKAKDGILNCHKSDFYEQRKINRMGFRRIIYYIIVAFTLLSLWYFITNNIGDNFITALLNAGGTVLLWEIMTLVLIERKNYQYRNVLKKKLLKMDIVFKYK